MRVVRVLAALLAVSSFGGLDKVHADWKPTKPVRVVIGFGAGGTTDVLGRLVAKKIEDIKGWKVIVENKTGAAGALAVADIKTTTPDGYIVGLVSTGLFSLTPYLAPNSPYQAEDLDYLGTIGTIEFALVVDKDAPFDDLAGMAAFSKKNGPITFSSTAKLGELTMQRLGEHFGFKIVSSQTSGSSQSLLLVLGGHAQATISGGVHVPYIESSKAKIIASLSDMRADYAPNVKTLQEQGAGDVTLSEYFLFFSPKGMPADVKAAWAAAIDEAVNTPEVKEHVAKLFSRRINLGADGARTDVMRQAKTWRDWLEKAKAAAPSGAPPK